MKPKIEIFEICVSLLLERERFWKKKLDYVLPSLLFIQPQKSPKATTQTCLVIFQCHIGLVFNQSRVYERLNPTCSSEAKLLSDFPKEERDILMKRAGLFDSVKSEESTLHEHIHICSSHENALTVFLEQCVKRNFYCLYPYHSGGRAKPKTQVKPLGEQLAIKLAESSDILQPFDSLICNTCLRNKVYAVVTKEETNRRNSHGNVAPQTPAIPPPPPSPPHPSAPQIDDLPMDLDAVAGGSGDQDMDVSPPTYEESLSSATPTSGSCRLALGTFGSPVSSVVTTQSYSQKSDPDYDDSQEMPKERRTVLNEFLAKSGHSKDVMPFTLKPLWDGYSDRSQHQALHAIAAATCSAICAVTSVSKEDQVRIYRAMIRSNLVTDKLCGPDHQPEELQMYIRAYNAFSHYRERVSVVSGLVGRYFFRDLDMYNLPDDPSKIDPNIVYFKYKLTKHMVSEATRLKKRVSMLAK